MNTIKKLLLAIMLLVINSSFSQLATLPPSICESYKPNGWIYFTPSSINMGELFTTYKSHFLTTVGNEMEVVRNWTDKTLNYKHRRYQQTFMGIEVEGCEFIVHSKQDGSLVYANGKICPKIHTKYASNIISENSALSKIVDESEHWESTLRRLSGNQEIDIILPDGFDPVFAWEDTSWESSLQIMDGDSSSTYFPTGELVFALVNPKNIQYEMNASDYALAWKFDILCLLPDFHAEIYVDAITGEIISVYNTRHYDGPANIPTHGSQTIDTRHRGWPNSDNVLEANNGNRKIHTKNHSWFGAWYTPWATLSEVDDDDDNWGSGNQEATAPHWMVTKAWDYFTAVHDREGMNNFSIVRVRSANDGQYGALYERSGGHDIIQVGYLEGDVYTADLAILAHEFSHGVDQHEGKLKYQTESGALDESFADIFGFLTYRWVTGTVDWTIGVDGSLNREQRNLQNPKILGIHYEVEPDSTLEELAGQPDTYGGEYFYPVSDWGYTQDAGGVHVNSGIMNHWFYMLSVGEIDVNDLGNSYTVFGVGFDKAAKITYYNFVNNMEKLSTFEDAMDGAITFAKLFYGECSFEHIQTENAWYAAGLGNWSSCAGASIDENELNFNLYPNPTSDNLFVDFIDSDPKTIRIYGEKGQLIKIFTNVTSRSLSINVSHLARGVYYINIDGESMATKKFIKK